MGFPEYDLRPMKPVFVFCKRQDGFLEKTDGVFGPMILDSFLAGNKISVSSTIPDGFGGNAMIGNCRVVILSLFLA